MRTRVLSSIAVALLAMSLRGSPLQAQAATICKDGTTSSATGKGACSGHGGVDAKATTASKKAEKKAEAAEKKAAKTEAKAETKTATKAAAEVMCTDGTMSKPGRGACSGHGGIKGSAAATKPATTPSLPAVVPPTAPARTRSEAKSEAPTAPKTATKTASGRGEDKDPTDAIAQCKDGLYSHAANRRGACSRHGGVAKFLKP
jgi:hypothetical protein